MRQTLTDRLRRSSKKSVRIAERGNVPNNAATLQKTSTCLKAVHRSHRCRTFAKTSKTARTHGSVTIAFTKGRNDRGTNEHRSRLKLKQTRIYTSSTFRPTSRISQTWKYLASSSPVASGEQRQKRPGCKVKQN
jgi:hypothetical protein